MNLAPLLGASPAIQLHTAAALLALLVGAVQLAGPKGTRRHRLLGWLWVGLMLLAAASSLLIHTIRQLGPFSLIHLLAVWTLIALPFAVHAARRGRIAEHRQAMVSLFLGALVVAGALTLLPGRLLHAVLLGP